MHKEIQLQSNDNFGTVKEVFSLVQKEEKDTKSRKIQNGRCPIPDLRETHLP